MHLKFKRTDIDMLTLEETLVSLEGVIDIPSVDNFTSILHRCRKEKNLAYANHVHTHICEKGLEVHKSLGNHLVPMFVDCGSAVNAQQVFNRLNYCNEFSWTSLIEGYIESGDSQHALILYEKMKDQHVYPSRYTFMALLKACTKLKCLEKGREMHIKIVEEEYESDHFIGSSLMGMYTKCGSLVEAHDVFEDLPVQDVVSWTALIVGYADQGLAAKALECFQDMCREGVAPDRVTYVYILKACAMLKALARGRNVHAEIRKKGFKRDVSISSALIDMYVKCDALASAVEVFDELPSRDVALWNILMAGYVEQGLNKDALNLYNRMQKEGVSPDASTFMCILKVCASSRAIEKGLELHKQIDSQGLKSDPFLGSTLVDMYSKFGLLEKAQETFDNLPVKEVVSWTALISGYTEHGLHEQALKGLKQMQQEGMDPDSITFMCCLRSVGSLGAGDKGQELHISIIEEGYDGDQRLASSLVDMYVKCGLVAEAQDVFDDLEDQDLVVWTSLIAGYADLGHGGAALSNLYQMQAKGLSPDAVTYVCCLKACCSTGSISDGRVLHSEVVKEGFEGDLFISNSLMDLYVKCGCLSEACDVFRELPIQDTISWTVLINAHVEEGLSEEALIIFKEMQSKGVSPNAATLVCSLKACGSIGDISRGHQIHYEVVVGGFEKDSLVGSTLVSMYAKCGFFDDAECMVFEFSDQGPLLWNALVSVYIEQGLGEEALAFSKRMQEEAADLDATSFICSLKACGAVVAVEDGHALHTEIVKRGFEQDHFVGSALVDVYAKCSLFEDAQNVFDKLLVRDVVLWNTLATRYAESYHTDEALKCLDNMQDEGTIANVSTYACGLKLCGSMGAIQKGRELHQEMVIRGAERNQLAASSLIGMYAKCGYMAEAREVFDKLTEPDLISWNTLITGYAEHGLSEEILNSLEKMRVSANSVTYINSLKACKSTGSFRSGLKVHLMIIEEGYEEDNIIGSTLVDMYANCGSILDAKEVFEELPVRDVFSWTALIAGYTEHGSDKEALVCYEQMQLNGVSPDIVTMVCSLQACGNLGDVDRVREMHVELAKKGFEQDLSVGNHLVQMYAKCSSLLEAQEVFKGLSCQDVVSWTALITGYADEGLNEEVLSLLEKMQLEGVSSDAVTFVCSLRALSSVGDINKGQALHTDITRKGFDGDPFIGNTLVGMYAKCHSFEEAHYIFDRLAVRDVVSWTALMGGFNEQGANEEALKCFEQMQFEGVLPDLVSWNAVISGYVEQDQSDKASLLYMQLQEQGLLPSSSIFLTMMKACGNTAALDAGRRFHAQILRVGCKSNGEVKLATAVIDMYGKCGNMFEAQQIFDACLPGDLAIWNALVAGYTCQGESELVFCKLDKMMNLEGIQPDDFTFVSAITACSHVGLVDFGQKYFQHMSKDYGIEPTMKHYNCLFDLLGRAGQVEEAVFTVGMMPFKADFVVWSTILGACQKWGDVELGRQAFKHCMRIEENHAAMFILMSNISVDSLED